MRTAAAIGVLLLLAALSPGRPWGKSQESFKPLRGPYMGQEAPIRPTVFLPGKISTGGNEGSSLFFPGARSFLWMTGRGGQDSVLLLEDKDGRWQPPRRIDFFGDRTDVHAFTIAPDGQWVYFASNRRTAGPGAGNIWRVRVESGDWSRPELLPSTVNGDDDEGYPSVTTHGELYFSRRGVASPSDSELWVAGRWNGHYRTAVRLGNSLNGPYADFDPFIAPDGRYLIFASRRPGGLGGSDLYISHRDPEDGWSRPVNLGAGINSPADEARPVVTLDGRYFFFTSNRSSAPQLPPGMPPGGSMPGNGSFDIWWTTTDLLPLNGGRLQDTTVDAAAGRGFAGSRRPNRLAVGPSDRPGGLWTRADQAARRGGSVESNACGQAGGAVPSGSARVPYLGQPPPGDRPVVFAPGLISDAGYRLHGAPIFSPDLTEVYWSVVPPRILVMRERDGVWSRPQPLTVAAAAPQAPCLSADGRRLYFQAAGPDGRGSVDLWWSDRSGKGWNSPTNVGSLVNTSQLESQPSLTAKGTLYYTGHLDHAWMQRGIYRARRERDGFSRPELLPPVINSPFLDYTPFIDPCERYLVFASSRPKRDEANLHLLITYRAEDGSWSPPTDLSEALGVREPARFPSVSPDGKFLFFLAGNHIYWVDAGVLERLRPRGGSP